MEALKDSLNVEVRFQIEKDTEGYPKSRDAESLLCKPLNAECSICVIASVPFYLKNVAYGDTIRTVDNPSGFLEFAGIVSRGGYSVYRILLRNSTNKEQTISKLLNLGTLVEHDGKLITVAVPPSDGTDTVLSYILEGKRLDLWGAQDGYIFDG